MTIISKSKKCVVNFDNVEKIYVSGDNVSIKADMKSGSIIQAKIVNAQWVYLLMP